MYFPDFGITWRTIPARDPEYLLQNVGYCFTGGKYLPCNKSGGHDMDFYKVPIGFGLAMAGNTAAMNRYAHLSEQRKQEILNRAHNVRSEKEMYALVAELANGTME